MKKEMISAKRVLRTLLCGMVLFGQPLTASAQIGEHRNTFSIGGNAGYVMSNVGFTPEVSQSMHGGPTMGLSLRYTTEKYFSTICSVYAEVNYSSLGWKENIVDINDNKVLNADGSAKEYSRTVNYVQVPLMAHLAWGREEKGLNFFINLGPQFGFYLSESTTCNYDIAQEKLDAEGGTAQRSNKNVAQESMPIEKKFDYGIAAGLGAEYSIPKVGHFLVEGRYYYGLGNIYGNSKRDYFGKSNYGNIVIKAAYLFDFMK